MQGNGYEDKEVIMKKLWFCSLLIIIFFSNCSFSQTAGLKERTIRFCAGIHEWPPYYYFKRVKGKKTKEVGGLDLDLFEEIFTKNGISYSVELLPWKRCLKEVMKGENYDIVFGGGLNEYRRANYITTEEYYTVMPSYLYSKNKFPAGIKAKTPSDLSKYGQRCGVAGFNYVNFGQRNEDIEMGAKNYEALVTKTLAHRCDISFVRYEILIGWEKLLNLDLIGNKNLVLADVPGIPPESFHLMISKNYQYAPELKQFFDLEVKKLQDSGKIRSLFAKDKNETSNLRRH
ncbi:MAG: polar amino acid transport system substrate-binding protein [Pseudohongiellaceae bacterium]|jgi:polar amino acid transport system substrate-binding protein